MQQIEKEAQERVGALAREVALYAIGPLIAELREEFSEQSDVLTSIEQIEENLPEHLQDFLPTTETGSAGHGDGPIEVRGLQRQERLARYEVNVLIDNGDV